jgi:4-azaleucine resistance transporter AzlC
MRSVGHEHDLLRGIRSGSPICIGYFPAAVAFGLVARDAGLLFGDALLFSVTNFAGASQFFAVNLIESGALLYEVVIGVLLVNLRYLLMSASLAPRIEERSPLIRGMLAFGNTDEVFAVASAQQGSVSTRFMIGIEVVSWAGWVSGTVTGFLVGSVLPGPLQHSIGITLYAMFTSLLVKECRRVPKYLVIALIAAGINSAAVLLFRISTGWAFALSMTIAAGIGTILTTGREEEESV